MQDVSLEEETKDDAASRPAALRHANSEMEVGGGKLVGQRANWWRTSPLPPAATFLATALFTVGFIALFTGMGVGAWYVIASGARGGAGTGRGADDQPVYKRTRHQSRGLLDAPGARRYWARATK